MFETVEGVRCVLGEGPMYDAGRESVYWVDIEGGTLWEAPLRDGRPGRPEVVLRREPTLSSAVHAEGGGWLLARRRGMEQVDAGGDPVHTVDLIPASVDSRLNDGKCDPAGRYLVGSMALDGRRGQERLWRLEPDGSVTVLDDDLSLSNGLGWSPDGATMYQIDTVAGTIWSREYAGPGPRRVLHQLDENDGGPDGLSIDAEGNLWFAVWGSGQIRVLSPEGTELERLDVGAPLVTSCAFAGPDLDLLVVTTASVDEPGVRHTGRSGALLTRRGSRPGLPTTAWKPFSKTS